MCSRCDCALTPADFAKFPFTVKENVGIGDVSRIHDDAAIMSAMKRGGVQLHKTDLDRPLNPTAIRQSSTSTKSGSTKEKSEKGTSKNSNSAPISLSGGQYQRLAIARAFMRTDADAVFFDGTCQLRCG